VTSFARLFRHYARDGGYALALVRPLFSPLSPRPWCCVHVPVEASIPNQPIRPQRRATFPGAAEAVFIG
jgi:hypothetical protein